MEKNRSGNMRYRKRKRNTEIEKKNGEKREKKKGRKTSRDEHFDEREK